MTTQVLENFSTSTLTDHPFSSLSAQDIGAGYGRNSTGLWLGASSGHHVRIPFVTARQTVFIEWAWNPLLNLAADNLLIGEEGGTTHFTVQLNVDGSLQVRLSTNGAILLLTAPGLIVPRLYPHIGLKYKVDDVAGEVELRVNGASAASVSGIDTRNAGTSGVISSARFEGSNSYLTDIALGDDTGSINTGFLGDVDVETSLVTAAGTYQEWPTLVGAATQREAVDELLHDGDTSYIASSTAGQRSTFAVAGLSGTPSSVKAVQVSAVVRKDDANASLLDLMLRNGATDGLSPDVAPSTVYGHVRHVFNADPATGAAWTPGGRATIEAGVKKVT